MRHAPARSCCVLTGGRRRARGVFPRVATALAGALMLHRRCVVQSTGERAREVDWCQSSALLVRREAAAQVDYLDPDFFVYSDEVDFARRLRDAGWRSVYVPQALAVHHEQLVDRRPTRAADRRTLARARPVHAQAPLGREARARALADRLELCAARAGSAGAARTRPAALLAPRDRHADPARGEGLREAADAYNRARRQNLRGRGRVTAVPGGRGAQSQPSSDSASTTTRRAALPATRRSSSQASRGERAAR